jgi:hypothetical protein
MKRNARRIHRVYHRTRIQLSSTRTRLRAWHVGVVALIAVVLLFVQGMALNTSKKNRCYKQAVEYSKQTILSSLEQGSSVLADTGTQEHTTQFESAYDQCMKHLL